MLTVVPYLTFPGTCEEAFLFYAELFGAENPNFMRFSQVPPTETNFRPTEDNTNQIMHTEIKTDTLHMMGSDSIYAPVTGNAVSLMLHIPTVEEQDRLFAGLAEGGQVQLPLEVTFWGARFGILVDRFGIQWQLHVQLTPMPDGPPAE